MPVSSVADAFLPLLPHEAGETSAALRLLHHVAQRAGSRLPSYMQEDPCPLLVPEEDLYVDYEHDDDGPSDSNSEGDLEELELRGQQGSPSGTHAREAAAEALPAVLPRPQTCSYFTPGQTFSGCQKLFGGGPGRARQEDWQVHVTIQSVDMASGCMTGTMEARNVPLTRGPILTFFEGEIIDNGRHTFLTHKWGASMGTDLAHWGKFPAFSSMARQVSRHGGRCALLGDCPYVFMRWKELFFVNAPQNCSLTIAGFYYVAMSRQDGRITGYYYDPHSAPFQELTLRPAAERGVAFGSYALK